MPGGSLVLTGTRGVRLRLTLLKDRTQDLRPAGPSIGEAVSTTMQRQFDTEGAFLGRPWAPLDPDYVAYKTSLGGSPRILVWTGDMMRSFTSRPMSLERYTKSGGEFGSTSKIAVYHQRGTSRGLPARPIMLKTSPMISAVTEAIADWILRGETKL